MVRLLLVAALLAAAPAAAEIRPANPVHDQLLRMSPIERNATFRGAITDAGLRCKRVLRSGFQQPYRNLMMWRADCEPARSIAIYVGPDGSVQARDCVQSAQLRLPACARLR